MDYTSRWREPLIGALTSVNTRKKKENATMRMTAFQSNISVRVLKILLTILTAAALYCGSLATGQTTSSASSNGPDDWKQVEAAMGRPGQMQPGAVIKFGMPRKDLHVVLD